MKTLSGLQPLGLLLLRVALGIIFIYHGYPKPLHQGAGNAGIFRAARPAGYVVYVAGILEVFGGGLLIWAVCPGGGPAGWRAKWLWPSGKCIAAAA